MNSVTQKYIHTPADDNPLALITKNCVVMFVVVVFLVAVHAKTCSFLSCMSSNYDIKVTVI